MVESLCATTMQVMPRSLMEFTTSYSVLASSALVASSRIIIVGSCAQHARYFHTLPLTARKVLAALGHLIADSRPRAALYPRADCASRAAIIISKSSIEVVPHLDIVCYGILETGLCPGLHTAREPVNTLLSISSIALSVKENFPAPRLVKSRYELWKSSICRSPKLLQRQLLSCRF